jgi:hypothetical protein
MINCISSCISYCFSCFQEDPVNDVELSSGPNTPGEISSDGSVEMGEMSHYREAQIRNSLPKEVSGFVSPALSEEAEGALSKPRGELSPVLFTEVVYDPNKYN